MMCGTVKTPANLCVLCEEPLTRAEPETRVLGKRIHRKCIAECVKVHVETCRICEKAFTRETPWRVFRGLRVHVACIHKL